MIDGKNRKDDDPEVVDDETSDLAVSTDGDRDPDYRPRAAANVVADAEAGADPDASAGIEPLDEKTGKED